MFPKGRPVHIFVLRKDNVHLSDSPQFYRTNLLSGTHHTGIIIGVIHLLLAGTELTAEGEIIRQTNDEQAGAFFQVHAPSE